MAMGPTRPSPHPRGQQEHRKMLIADGARFIDIGGDPRSLGVDCDLALRDPRFGAS